MKKYAFALLALFTFIFGTFFSCNRSAQDKNAIQFNRFPTTSKIQFKEYFSFDTTVEGTDIFLNDTSIFIANRGRSLMRNYLFYEYSLQSKKLIGKFIKWGTQDFQTYGPMSVGLFRKETLWLHDMSLNKVVTIPLKDKYSFDSVKCISKYNTPQFAYSVQLMDSNKLLESGMFDIPKYYLQVNNLITTKPIKQIGNFIPPNNDYPKNTWKAAFESFLFLKPNEKKAILACRYADRITLLNLDTGTCKIITGPTNFDPSFVPIPQNTSTKGYSIDRTPKTIFAFLGGAVTDRFIYLIFSGQKESAQHFYLGNTVYIYDWNGNPIKKLLFNRYVSSIAISDDDKKLYAIDPIQKKIIYAQL